MTPTVLKRRLAAAQAHVETLTAEVAAADTAPGGVEGGRQRARQEREAAQRRDPFVGMVVLGERG